jgi:serine/threonine protein kinase/WD40 repeat protein
MTPSEAASLPAESGCPSREVLLDFALGKLSAAEIDRIGGHVEQCITCQSVLDTLDSLEDSVVADLHTPGLEGFTGPPTPRLSLFEEFEQSQRVTLRDSPPGDPHRQPGQADTGGLGASPTRLGQYELLVRIGRGGMGSVYRAFHRHLKRAVAVKLLPPDRIRSPQAVSRFLREMQAVGQLDHPNLVRAHDAGQIDGQYFLVMDLIEGIDFGRLVRDLGPLSVPDACEVIRQAAFGLAHAHENGLIHRDVKPSNLMLTVQGQVKLLDLGLARLAEEEPDADSLTSPEQVMGTGDFIAPEQGMDTRRADARSDVYSLGCTLYCLLAGHGPFHGPPHDTFVKKVMAHVHEAIPPLSDLRDDLPDDLAEALDRMLVKEPDRRVQSAEEVAEFLSPWADQSDLPGLIRSAFERGLLSESPSLIAATGTSTAKSRRSSAIRGSGSLSASKRTTAATTGRQNGETGATKRLLYPLLTGVTMLGIGAAAVGMMVIPRGPWPTDAQPAVSSSVTPPAPQPPVAAKVNAPGDCSPVNALALVQRPRSLPQVPWWTVETRGERAPINVLAVSPDDQTIATGSEAGCVRFWNAQSGEMSRVVVEAGPIRGLAWSPHGRFLVVASGRLNVWKADSGHRVWQAPSIEDDPATAVAWPDRELLVSGHRSGRIRLWNPDTRQLLATRAKHSVGVTALAAAHGGDGDDSPSITATHMASGDADGNVWIWDLPGCEAVHEIAGAEPGPIRRLQWSPDGRRLASCAVSSKTITLRQVDEGWHATVLEAAIREVTDLAWSPTGDRLTVSTGLVGSDDMLRIWDGDVKRRLYETLISRSSATALGWAGNSSIFYLGTADGGLLASTPEGRWSVLRTASTPIMGAVAWSPEGRRIAMAGHDGTCRVWDVGAGQQTWCVSAAHPMPMLAVAWSKRGDLLAVGGRDSTIRLLEASSGRLKQEIACAGFVMDVAFSPDGARLASAESDGLCRVWETSSGRELHRFDVPGKTAVTALAWSPDGTHLSWGARDENIYLADADGGRPLTSWKAGHGQVRHLLWDPPSGNLLSSGLRDGVRTWQVPEGRLLAQDEGDLIGYRARLPSAGPVACCVASGTLRDIAPDGQHRVTRRGGACFVEDLASGLVERVLCPLASDGSLAVDPDGHWSGRPGANETPVYVIQHQDRQENLTPEQFQRQFE